MALLLSDDHALQLPGSSQHQDAAERQYHRDPPQTGCGNSARYRTKASIIIACSAAW